MRHLASPRRAVMALVLAMSSRAWGEAGVGVAVTMTAEELQAMNGSPVDATSTDRDGLVAMGYTLVEDTPRCYFVLGANYCPAPGALFLESVSRRHGRFSVSVRPLKSRFTHACTRPVGLNSVMVCVVQPRARAGPTCTCRRSRGRRRSSPTWPGTSSGPSRLPGQYEHAEQENTVGPLVSLMPTIEPEKGSQGML